MTALDVFSVMPDSSAVLVEARSNVGPITFGTLTVDGRVELKTGGTDVDSAVPVSASVQIPVSSLESGNSLYDAELRRRLDQRSYPTITVELRSAQSRGGGRFAAEGDVTIHGTTRRLSGTVVLSMPDTDTLVAEGTELIDIRDFAIGLPTALMLKIYPDVSVQFRITGVRDPAPPGLQEV